MPAVRQFAGDIRMWKIETDDTRTAVIPSTTDADLNTPIEAEAATTTYEAGDEVTVLSRRRGARYNQPIVSDQLPGTTQISLTLQEMPPIILARALFGEAANADVTAGTVTDADVVITQKGVPIILPHRYLTGTITLSDGGTPLTAGTDYTVDTRRGTLVVLPAASVADGDTLQISYGYLAVTGTRILGGAVPVVPFYITGDMEDRRSSDNGLLEVFRAELTVDGEVNWLSQEPLTVTLTGNLLVPEGAPAPYTFDLYRTAA